MPTMTDLFPGEDCDGPCSGCGAQVNNVDRQTHLTWHQALWNATQATGGVG